MNDSYELMLLFGKPVLFANERIKDEDVPDGLYKYESRYDDSLDGDMVEVKSRVLVNFLGTIISKEKLDDINVNGMQFNIEDGMPVDSDNYGFEGEYYTMEDYFVGYDELLDVYSDAVSNITSDNVKLRATTVACQLISLLDSINDDDFVDEIISCVSSNDAFTLGQMAISCMPERDGGE